MQQRGPNVPPWEQEVLQDIVAIICHGDVRQLIEDAKKVGSAIRSVVTPTQIRNIFGPVRHIQLRWCEDEGEEARAAFRQVMLLRPKLAYQARRIGRREFYSLEKVLSRAIEEIGAASEGRERRQRFQHFLEFLEAILAYHGGQ